MPTSSPLHLLRLKPVELLRQPGIQRHIDAEVAPADIGIDDDRLTGDVVVDVDAVSSVDGITVKGTASVPWSGVCRRCAEPTTGVAVAAVDEVFQTLVSDEDANPIEGDYIDLAPIVRELVLLEIPDAPLCRDDCAGLCQTCGTNRNVATCDCVTETRDPRWAALDDLKLDADS